MKKLSLFTILLLLCMGFLQAQSYTLTVSGQVTDISNGNPLANYPVDVYLDSANFLGFSYYNTVTTDMNGNYSDVIAVPSGVTSGTGYTGLRDCTPAGYPMNTFTYTTSANNITNLDFAICTTTSGGCQAYFSSQWVMGTTVVNFTDLSTTGAPASSWSWSFGDGNTSTLQNPSHAYNALGAYTVCLTVTDTSGCTDTYCDSVYTGGSSVNCQAAISANVGPLGVTTFTTTAGGTGSPYNYYFDFGDGTFANGSSSTASHTYTASGTYTACVYVDFTDSCRAVSCANVTIGGLPGSCQAGYYWYPDSSGQYSIIVVNTSSASPGATYQWTFGDGSSSNQQYPSHTYNGPGTYTVCVTVTDSNCTDTYCDSLVVVNKVATPFSINVIADGTTAVNPPAADMHVSLFPNPAHDFVQVQMNLNTSADVNVSFTDLTGKVVAIEHLGARQAGQLQATISTSELPAGLYLARIQAGQSSTTQKLMIAR